MVRTAGSTVAVLVAALAVSACSGSRSASDAEGTHQIRAGGLRFVPASAAVRAACRATALSVGYPVPCPMLLPAGFADSEELIGTGSSSWRGWVLGSSIAGQQHLVVTGSPRPLHSYAKVVNGPMWYPRASVRPLAWVTINGWRMRAVFVPPETNDGSAFAHHVVLIWTVGQHTYGVGFHNLNGLSQTLLLDKELARHIRLVGR